MNINNGFSAVFRYVDLLTQVCVFKLFSIDLFIFLLAHFCDLVRKKMLFHLLKYHFQYTPVIMAVALVPASDQAIFDNISLVRIGACLDDRQECIKMVSTVWTACLCRWFDQCAIPTTAESKLWIMQLMALRGIAQ